VWREAPVFGVDLADDPLERRPVRIRESETTTEQRDTLKQMREYWESGVVGPLVRLPSGDEDEVMGRLRGLGYVD
jgi:hypothetical protein